MIDNHAKIYVAGHRGLAGSAFLRRLAQEGCTNVITRTRAELDLLDAVAVQAFFKHERPEYVILAAAKVGGIHANNVYGADFIYENLTIQTAVIKASHDVGVKKLLYLGSSCIYPRDCPQPIREEYFLQGLPEETNKPYAAAKIAGILTCQAFHKQYGDNFISLMPTNLYGPYDNFDLETAHAFPALLRKFYEAKKKNAPTVTVWGSGKPRREFMHVDDLAEAGIFLLNNYDQPEIVNVGTGQDISIKEFAELVSQTVGYHGNIVWDASRPDGTPQKLLDVSKLTALGWTAKVDVQQGVRLMLDWYRQHEAGHG